MPPTDTGTPTPTVRDLAAQAVKTWALSYPIPAWNLAEGEAAERLAAAWGRTAADAVLASVAPVIREQGVRTGREEAAQAISDYIDRWYPEAETSEAQRLRRKALRTAALIAAPEPTAEDIAAALGRMSARVTRPAAKPSTEESTK